jgi:hypothetical protein
MLEAMTQPELWTETQLASGERRLLLRPPASKRASLAWGGLSAGLALGGLWLLARGSCLFGLVLAAVGAWMLFSLFRLLTRKEAWVVSPGSARRQLRGVETQLTLVRRLRFEAETDSDERELLRLFVVHGEGETPVGETWERSDDLEGLAAAFGAAIGVPVDSVPDPVPRPR